MVFESQDSIWFYVLAGLTLLIVIGLVAALVKNKMTNERLCASLVAIVVCAGGGLLSFTGNVASNDASFNKQLMDEYHATSNRSFSTIKREAIASGASNAVFTKDGKDTPVFIKLGSHDDKTMAMQFIVLDDRSLYPKP